MNSLRHSLCVCVWNQNGAKLLCWYHRRRRRCRRRLLLKRTEKEHLRLEFSLIYVAQNFTSFGSIKGENKQ